MHGLIDFIFGVMTKDINCFNWQFLSYRDWENDWIPSSWRSLLSFMASFNTMAGSKSLLTDRPAASFKTAPSVQTISAADLTIPSLSSLQVMSIFCCLWDKSIDFLSVLLL